MSGDPVGAVWNRLIDLERVGNDPTLVDALCAVLVDTSAAVSSPLTPGEALAKLFLDNADHGRHAANDVLVEELLARRRAIQAFANPSGQ